MFIYIQINFSIFLSESFSFSWLTHDCHKMGIQFERVQKDTAYNWLDCLLKRRGRHHVYHTHTPPAPEIGTRLFVFWQAGQVRPLDGWHCCSPRREMSSQIQDQQTHVPFVYVICDQHRSTQENKHSL